MLPNPPLAPTTLPKPTDSDPWGRVHKLQLFCLTAAALLIPACSEQSTSASHAGAHANRLRLAVTTSTRDAGLMQVLVPVFEQQHNARVEMIAVGTGKAIKLGENGDVDILLVHAEQAEKQFMSAGHGTRREPVMYNTFELVGPSADPAGVSGMSAVDALRKIAADRHPFVSRGDDSGTHKRERHLWRLTGSQPQGDHYIETGQGMGATLIIADQMQAYTLTDRGTYLAFKNKIELAPLPAAGDELVNPYAVMTVNPTKHKRINHKLADAFVDFLISPQAQEKIAAFRIAGEPLFHPLRLSP